MSTYAPIRLWNWLGAEPPAGGHHGGLAGGLRRIKSSEISPWSGANWIQ